MIAATCRNKMSERRPQLLRERLRGVVPRGAATPSLVGIFVRHETEKAGARGGSQRDTGP